MLDYDTSATGNCEHNLTPSQINIKAHTKGLPTSVPSYTVHHVQLSTKLQCLPKINKNLKKQQHKYSESETDSDKADILVISDGI